MTAAITFITSVGNTMQVNSAGGAKCRDVAVVVSGFSDCPCQWSGTERSCDCGTATERRITLNTAVLMEIENLRRESLAALREKYREVFQEETRSRHREHLFRRIAWRLQALAEGDLSERARGRAQQIERDADLRTVAPRDFFTLGGEPVRTTPGEGKRRPPDSRLPLPGTLLSRKWKGRTI